MTAFDKAWDVVKSNSWENRLREFASKNINQEWYDSEYELGSEEKPIIGYNFDDWSYEIRNAISMAMVQALGGDEEDWEEYSEELGETLEEESWNRATNDTTNPIEGMEYAIKIINKFVSDLKYEGMGV